MQLPDRAAVVQWLRRPRSRVLLAVLAFLLAVRIALPYVLRPIIVDQADKALVGRIALKDLDLSLIRGGVTLHGLEVYPEELPPPGSPDASKKPLFEAGRLWTQISWLQLLFKTIDVEEFELHDFRVRLDRLKDGLALPKPVPSAEPEPPKPAKPEAPGSGWTFAADSLALRGGNITFRDYTVGEAPQRFDLAIDNIAAQKLALRFDPSGAEPGHAALEAELGGGGKIGYEADVQTREAGPAVHSQITLTQIPIGGARVYLAMFGWSDLSGFLDARIQHVFETGGAHTASGTVALTRVNVLGPQLPDHPVLQFERFAVKADKIDIAKQDAAISEVTLAKARIVVDPKLPRLLPLILPPKDAAAAPEPAAPEPAKPKPPPEEAEKPAKPWTWSVGRAKLDAAKIEVLPLSAPLTLGVDAEIQKLASSVKQHSPVSLAVSEGSGKLELTGELALEPLAFDGKLALRDFALPLLAVRAPVAGGELLRGGVARGDLAIALAPRAGASPAAADLRVAGTLGLAGLAVGKANDPDFSAGWKDLELQLKEVRVAPATGGDPAQPRAIDVAIDLLHLVGPEAHLTRTAQGLVLPPFGGAKGDGAKAEPTPVHAAPAAPAPQIRAELAKLRVEDGRARLSDHSVKPFYEGKIEKLTVRGRGIRWPGPAVDATQIELEGLQGAKLFARFGLQPKPKGSVLNAKLDGLLLPPLNPYVAPTGYSVANGALSFTVDGKMKDDAWESTTKLRVDQLEVGGSEGEAVFQESFGIPLSMALGLLKDTEGAITLNVPVNGDRAGAHVGVASIARQALRKALMGALASPLKLLGMGTSDGKVTNLAPAPVEFRPGSVELPPDSASRVDQLGGLLSASPGIALTLHGSVAESDERAMRARVVLVDLQQTSTFGALANLGEIRVRRDVRKYLEKRAEGEDVAPDPETKAWLDKKIEATTLEPDALDQLAQARALALQQALVGKHGVDAQRVVVGAPVSGQSAPVPGVTIDVGTRDSATR